MRSSTVSTAVGETRSGEVPVGLSLVVDRPQTEEDPADRGNALRGAVTGIILGTGAWTAIFLLVATFRH